MTHHFLYQEIQIEKSKMSHHFWKKLMSHHFYREMKPGIIPYKPGIIVHCAVNTRQKRTKRKNLENDQLLY